MKKKYIFTVIAIIFMIVAFMFYKLKSKENYTENGNFANMGLVVCDNTDIFYNNYPEGIYKINSNGEESIITDELAYSINLKDDWIYYMTLGEESFKLDIVRIKKDGTDRKVIATINSTYTRFFIKNNMIFYSNHDSGKSIISKMDLDGNNITPVIEDMIQNFQVTNKFIYYTDKNNSIIRVNLNGKKAKKITEDGKVKNFQVYGKYIYFIGLSSNRLERVNLSTKRTELVSSNISSEPFNISNDIVYYYDSHKKKICSYDLKTCSTKELVDINNGNTFINILKNEMFYIDNLKINRLQLY